MKQRNADGGYALTSYKPLTFDYLKVSACLFVFLPTCSTYLSDASAPEEALLPLWSTRHYKDDSRPRATGSKQLSIIQLQ